MLLTIPDVLTAEQVAAARDQLANADWTDGRVTAGPQSARVKNNRQLPVCAYNAFNLSTPDGFDLRFMASKEGCFDALAEAIKSARQRR